MFMAAQSCADRTTSPQATNFKAQPSMVAGQSTDTSTGQPIGMRSSVENWIPVLLMFNVVPFPRIIG
jgi:hypothetical protein